jgi:hypothetical protein
MNTNEILYYYTNPFHAINHFEVVVTPPYPVIKNIAKKEANKTPISREFQHPALALVQGWVNLGAEGPHQILQVSHPPGCNKIKPNFKYFF